MREIFIERRDKLLRIAIKDDERLTDCFMEEDDQGARPGQIYKGIVKNIVPGIKCAFLDIGFEKNAYLYMDNKLGNMNIKKGDELVVEVLKEEIGDKGPKVTNAISIAGRYVALITMNQNVNFSSKITDEQFKKHILEKVNKPKDVGMMIRTSAQGVASEVIDDEFKQIYNIYKGIIQESSYSIKPKLLYSDEGVLDKVLRDSINEQTSKIVVDNKEDYVHIKDFISTKLNTKISLELYDERITLFDYYGIEKEILNLRNSRVNLSCGGYIVIEKTEAMYVIDVNSGKNVGGKSIQRTAMVTNLEAAQIIPEQIRLRNLSGIILVDFIDINDAQDKKKIIDTLESGFYSDKNKTIVFPFTELNLVQIARRRRGKSINEYMEESCPECRGKGRKFKISYLLLLIKNELLRIDGEDKIKDIYIEINESYKSGIESDILNFIKEVGGMSKRIYLNFTSTVEYFKVEPLIFMNQIQSVEKFKVYG